MYGKLKTWKEHILMVKMTNFDGQNVSYDMYCNATTVLTIDSNCIECNYIEGQSKQCSMLSDSWCWVMAMDVLMCRKRHEQLYRKKNFYNLAEGHKKINEHIIEAVIKSKSVKSPMLKFNV